MAITSYNLKTMSILSNFILSLISFPYVVLSSSFSIIQLPPTVTGPESVALDPLGGGPYAGVADGRILKWQGSTFIDFAITSPNRTKQSCDGTTDPELGPICGRPLGFSFNYLTGDLYIVDAFLDLHVVGPKGGLATGLPTGAEGVPFKSLDGVDVVQLTGIVYFSDASSTYDLRNISQPNFKPDSSGRLLKYDPWTKQTTVLLKGLSAPVGPVISPDRTFVLLSEYATKRILRFWLQGLKANTAEVFLNLTGNPSKIKRSTLGDFFVAVNVRNAQPTPLTIPLGLRFNAFGTPLETIEFSAQYYNKSISVVQEQNGALYIGSRFADFIGLYRR